MAAQCVRDALFAGGLVYGGPRNSTTFFLSMGLCDGTPGAVALHAGSTIDGDPALVGSRTGYDVTVSALDGLAFAYAMTISDASSGSTCNGVLTLDAAACVTLPPLNTSRAVPPRSSSPSCTFSGQASPPFPWYDSSDACPISGELARGGVISTIMPGLALLSTSPSDCNPQGLQYAVALDQGNGSTSWSGADTVSAVDLAALDAHGRFAAAVTDDSTGLTCPTLIQVRNCKHGKQN